MIEFDYLIVFLKRKLYFIDQAEHDAGDYCFYDDTGDKVIQYLPRTKSFYLNSATFAHKRPKRDINSLTPLTPIRWFNFAINGV